ncbi:glycosyltransferase family 2 protein [Falsirhodobacter halotolerans]|uniref:glycosyltransferase family 2 protein n=1 Tax=Falsirhodobacter halotolerans TaxID=1146892 RepID=UPI001FD03000|nr:glycosyltransferase family 2 protein [Falsirhodobacter halotolerans]MCJ8140594.1 glycosyltransferase family 2 protein [Falsirhodobacter halotolerans]
MGDMIRALKARWRTRRAVAEIEGRTGVPRAHGMACPVVVSLTSYPARYATLARTLRGLMRQTVRADRTVLWLAHGDEASLPAEVRETGVEVRLCDDIRSYKKIIPALAEWPEAAIVTADDDVYYPADWLERLLAGTAPVRALRAHRVRMDGPRPAPYAQWARNIAAPEGGALIFPTGVLGVLYMPGSFHTDVLDRDAFMTLAPNADDVWLYWMHRRAGARAEKVGGKLRVLEWPGSQTVSLRSDNLAQGNDRAIAAMTDRYGFPSSEG